MPIYEAECLECGHIFEYYSVQITDESRNCPVCTGITERLFSLSHPAFFQSFVTKNIDPSGMPIHVKSQRQLSELCNRHNLVHLDDPKMDIKPFRPKTAGEVLGMTQREEKRAMEGGPARKEDVS
jgi:putative FmdB family regulatory protein